MFGKKVKLFLCNEFFYLASFSKISRHIWSLPRSDDALCTLPSQSNLLFHLRSPSDVNPSTKHQMQSAVDQIVHTEGIPKKRDIKSNSVVIILKHQILGFYL